MSTIQIKDGALATKYYNVIEAGTASEPHEPVIPPYSISYAIGQIFKNDAVTVSVQEKAEGLIKFGENSNIGTTPEIVWLTGGTETYLTANSINEIISTDVGDTQDVVIEGLTISGSDFTNVTQTATLNGTTGVTLTTPLARVNRAFNDDTTNFAGTITVLINGGATYLTITTDGVNQSQKTAYTTQSTEYLILTHISFSAQRNTTAKVDFNLQVRKSGKVFRNMYKGEATDTSGTKQVFFDIPLIISPNSDIRVCAVSSAASTNVTAAFSGYLAVIT